MDTVVFVHVPIFSFDLPWIYMKIDSKYIYIFQNINLLYIYIYIYTVDLYSEIYSIIL